MSRLKQCFAELRASNRCALIPYIAAGHPQADTTVDIMHGLVAAGADVLELGVPFSDPMADGPVIQQATEQAIANGVGLMEVLDMVAEFRLTDTDTPLVLMGYLNSFETHDLKTLFARVAEVGVDGLLLVDLPPEEAEDYSALFEEYGLDPIMLVAPTTREQRLESIARLRTGFVYYVSLKGITGAGTLDLDAVQERLAVVRSYVDSPVGVGFGIKTPAQAARIAGFADAVIIGSALVSKLNGLSDAKSMVSAAKEFLEPVRTAMDAARE